MAHQLSFKPSLSCEEMALRRVVISLWNEMDILPVFLFEDVLLQSVRCYDNIGYWRAQLECEITSSDKWRETVEAVKVKVSQLAMPKLLKKRMMHICKIIGLEMLRWKVSLHGPERRDGKEFLDANMLKQLCWTPEGRLDYQKTAEMLVKLETLDISKRFQLACTYFLENEIQDIWRELPHEYKRKFQNEENPLVPSFWKDEVTEHESYWSCIVTKSEYKLDSSVNTKAFRFSARSGNYAATKYFFQKLTDEERNSTLMETVPIVLEERHKPTYENPNFPKENLTVVLSYLLQQLNSEQLVGILQQHSYKVLSCFLDWPWHDYFLNIADIMWPFLPDNDVERLLREMAEKAHSSGFYFPEVFQVVFLRSPRTLTECETRLFQFFCAFFFVEDSDTIKLVLKNVYAVNKPKLFLSQKFFGLLDDELMKNKFHLVRNCLLEITKHEFKDMVKFIYVAHLSSTQLEEEFERRRCKWNDMFRSLTEEDVPIEGSEIH